MNEFAFHSAAFRAPVIKFQVIDINRLINYVDTDYPLELVSNFWSRQISILKLRFRHRSRKAITDRHAITHRCHYNSTFIIRATFAITTNVTLNCKYFFAVFNKNIFNYLHFCVLKCPGSIFITTFTFSLRKRCFCDVFCFCLVFFVFCFVFLFSLSEFLFLLGGELFFQVLVAELSCLFPVLQKIEKESI